MGKSWTIDNIKIPTIKYLATGGIIDNPGRGVPLASNVVGGEKGAEGVIPLTDPTAMETLGRIIGKYTSVNVTSIAKLDSKTIFRQTQKQTNQLAFETNGR